MALSNGQVALNAADVPANEDSTIAKSGSDNPTEVLDPVLENNNPQTPDKLEMQRLIQLTREMILALIEQDPSLYNPGDIELAKNDDWQVERFLLKKGRNVDEAAKMIDDTMRWRHKLNMPNLKDQDFPIEFFKIGAIFGYESDRNGNGVVYMRVRMHKRIPEIDETERLFILHTINKMDQKTNGKGMVIVFDCKGVGVSNVDMDMMLFLINSLIKYYPYGLKNILVYEMPWLLTQTWRIIHGLLPVEYRDLIKMVDKKSIFEYIDPENLPLYMGGQCLRNFHRVPDDCKSAQIMGEDIGLSPHQITKIFKVFQPLLNEAQAESDMLEQKE